MYNWFKLFSLKNDLTDVDSSYDCPKWAKTNTPNLELVDWFTLKSHLLLVNFYSVLAHFQIKRAHFTLCFIHTFYFLHKLYYFKKVYSSDNLFSSPQKVGPNAQQHPAHHFPNHQKYINLNDWKNIQSLSEKVSIFKSSSNDLSTVQYFYVVI